MDPKLDDNSYPLWGRVSTPQMIIAQIDSIVAKQIIAPLRRKVLRNLEGLIKANKTQHWFTIYISIFLLLHNVSVISSDLRRHGKANGATVRDNPVPPQIHLFGPCFFVPTFFPSSFCFVFVFDVFLEIRE